jgi:hypothetical protein
VFVGHAVEHVELVVGESDLQQMRSRQQRHDPDSMIPPVAFVNSRERRYREGPQKAVDVPSTARYGC